MRLYVGVRLPILRCPQGHKDVEDKTLPGKSSSILSGQVGNRSVKPGIPADVSALH